MNIVDLTGRPGRGWPASGLVAAGLLAWLWPIGLGGRMPVGGDVTQFSIGLMAVLGESLRAGRLPLWNDLWGYGFPGVGESQMGVFYPPHWLLYGLLSVERGYTASLVLHTVWGGLGAAWGARKFGVSDLGSALTGFAWGASGFFLIHLPHQWGATTGCWLPWAWGLAWQALRGDRPGRSALGLVLVLTVQLLPGHFQLAFVTQVGVVALGIAAVLESVARGRPRVGRPALLALAIGGAFLLGAAQVWPTLRLARLAESRRDFEYLSGFAASPLHLVTFLAPGLFERSPLWRMVVWDPFHTSPEEYLGYVGLAPLCLAALAVRRGLGRSAEVRALAIAGLVCLLLAMGPYVPGFRVWSTGPGFSFFRAPARWMIGFGYAVCVLAGLGFDGLKAWPGAGASIRRFAILGTMLVGLAVGLVEVGLRVGDVRGSAVAEIYTAALDLLPWGETGVYARIVADANRPFLDHRVEETWARQGVVLKDAPIPVFDDLRGSIYVEELGPSVALFAALWLLSLLAARPARLQAALFVLTLADLLTLGRDRRIDLGPIAPLTAQSPVLAHLAGQPRGTRTIDTIRNLPMVAGAAPVSAYRTLDLPVLEGPTYLATMVPNAPAGREPIARARVATGAVLRIFEPAELAAIERLAPDAALGLEAGPILDDPALAGWRLGADWVAQEGPSANRFRIDRVQGGGVRAWLVPLTPAREGFILGDEPGAPDGVLQVLDGARPVPLESSDPEHVRATFEADGPALLVLSILADPQWRGAWGDGSEAPVRRAFGRPGRGAWMAVPVAGAGRQTLTLTYQADDVWLGLGVSAASGLVLIGLTAAGRIRARRRDKERT